MSWNPSLEPGCPDAIGIDAIETLIVPRARDLGDFEVRRALPAPKRQMVGPFIFFDQAGPAEFVTGKGVDVRPHPHIGLGTVTYLFRGEFQHRDSIGSDQMILPGAVNWMIAGRGVTHSERTSEETRQRSALAVRYPDLGGAAGGQRRGRAELRASRQGSLPVIEARGLSARLILGSAFGQTAPAQLSSRYVLFGCCVQAGVRFPLPVGSRGSRALYRRRLGLHRRTKIRGWSHDGVPAGRWHHGCGGARKGLG